jgi:hypothetical protein
MKGEGTDRSGILRGAGISRDLLRFWNQIQSRSCHARCVQHLADGTSRFGSPRMLVEKRGAGRDIQQGDAAQQGQRLQ